MTAIDLTSITNAFIWWEPRVLMESTFPADGSDRRHINPERFTETTCSLIDGQIETSALLPSHEEDTRVKMLEI